MNYVGIGYDVHQLVEGRKLVLGGVVIPHNKGLMGHSDADALTHAICDAILGALGERDIGYYFPNTDKQWQNSPSKFFLHEVASKVKLRHGRISNIDATVIAEEPKIAPYVEEMRNTLADALGITNRHISIKATTNETLGAIGRGEGIAAMAVASLDLPEPR